MEDVCVVLGCLESHYILTERISKQIQVKFISILFIKNLINFTFKRPQLNGKANIRFHIERNLVPHPSISLKVYFQLLCFGMFYNF